MFGFVRKDKLDALQESLNRAVQMQLESYMRLGGALGECKRLEVENARLRSEMNWFKHRLTQVERERGQLIQAAIGVKVAVPEFVPTYEDPGQALNDMPNLSTVGGDAVEDPEVPGDMNPGIDYSMMPGYKRSE